MCPQHHFLNSLLRTEIRMDRCVNMVLSDASYFFMFLTQFELIYTLIKLFKTTTFKKNFKSKSLEQSFYYFLLFFDAIQNTIITTGMNINQGILIVLLAIKAIINNPMAPRINQRHPLPNVSMIFPLPKLVILINLCD